MLHLGSDKFPSVPQMLNESYPTARTLMEFSQQSALTHGSHAPLPDTTQKQPNYERDFAAVWSSLEIKLCATPGSDGMAASRCPSRNATAQTNNPAQTLFCIQSLVRTGETYLRPLSGMAGSQGSSEGMGIAELTTAGY